MFNKIRPLLFLSVLAANLAQAQIINAAHWAYGLKKIADNTYEVHLQCTIDKGWHIYAQEQTADFVGTATKITFIPSSGLTLIGKPAEIGEKETYKVPDAGITNNELLGKVDFVQKVELKPGLKMIRGVIIYQTCTHEKCLTEQKLNFTIPVPDNN